MNSGTGAITAIHLTIIVVLTILTIVAIAWGMKLKRARVAAAREFAENERDTRVVTTREQEDLGADPLQDAPPGGSQTQAQSQSFAPSPVAPPPPPMTDDPAPGTPPETGRLADEPIAAAAPMDASYAAEAAPESAAPTDAGAADRPVTTLKGLGPKVAAALAARGITTVGQIAALDAGRADALDADLGPFRGRMARDRWVEQARFLAAGDVKGFEQVFGRL